MHRASKSAGQQSDTCVKEQSDWWLGAAWRIEEGEQKRSNIDEVRRISEDELVALERAFSELDEVSQSNRLSNCLELNRNDLVVLIVELGGAFLQTRSIAADEMESVMTDASRILLNLLAMFRIFVEHTEVRLRKVFGERSEEFTRWKAKTAECYDSSFAYRLFYKLRNYGVHVGVPPLSISLHASRDDEHVTLALSLDRDALLKANELWGSKVRADLANAPSKIAFYPLLEEWDGCWLTLRRTLLSITSTAALDAARSVLALRKGVPEERVLYLARTRKDDATVAVRLDLRDVPEALAQSVVDGHQKP